MLGTQDGTGQGTQWISNPHTPHLNIPKSLKIVIYLILDQIEVFKITHGIEGLDSGMFFKYRTDNGTRGHSWTLAKERCKLDISMHFLNEL